MAVEVVQCPHCQGSEVVKYGTASNGKARYRCQQGETCGRTFIRAVCVSGVLARGEAANGRDDAQWEWRTGYCAGAAGRPDHGDQGIKKKLPPSRR